MNINQPLYWHQGLFLQPQHFQLNDAGMEQRLARTTELTRPYPWGLISLKINESALVARQCLLDQLSLRFPEGTLVEYPGNAVLESRSLDLSDFTGSGRTLYVGLRRLIPGESNVQVFESLADAGRAETRFAVAADPELIADRLGDAPEAHVRPLSYVLRLFWDNEREHLSNFELLPIARLELDGDRVRAAPRYVPACINLSASPMLMQTLREVRDELVGRARQLSVFKQPDARRGEMDASQLNYMLALAVLNRYGPLLTHLLETPEVSPWVLYGTLRQLVGELSLFSERCDMLGETLDGHSLVPPYRHEDAGQAIIGLAQLIGQQLNEISVGSELLVRLQLQDGVYRGELPEAFFGPRHRYYLVARSAGDPDLLVDSLPRDGKLGAATALPALINRALPGIELIYLQVPPQGLPRVSDALYFRLETLSDAWEALQQERLAAFFLPAAPADLMIELVVVRT